MKQFLFLLIFSVLFFACKKDDMPSNEDWSEDDNIFRCKVNGVDWEPKEDDLGFSGGNLDVYYENFFNNAIQFRASKDDDDTNQFISMGFFVSSGVLGEFEILNNNLFIDFNKCGNYYRDTSTFNFISITQINSINNIIEGEFEFTSKNSDCNNSIVVTDGYFKTLYRN